MSEEEISITKTAACPSLSGSSTITYDIGRKGECQYFRLTGNSAGGLFCKEWVSLADIQSLLAGNSKPTSKTLQPIYVGKSANSPGFLLACILHEKPGGNDGVLADPVPETPSEKPSKARKGKKDGDS